MDIHRDRNRGYQGPRERRMGNYCLMGTKFPFGMMKGSGNA